MIIYALSLRRAGDPPTRISGHIFRGGSELKRVGLVFAVVMALMVGSGAPAAATIHPIMVGWVCGDASGDPPGQTPGLTHSDQSTLRAIQSTGLLTFTTTGPTIDLTVPASKFSTFDPVTETGTPSNQGALHCTKG